MNTKFTLLFLAALTIAAVSDAQINKGNIALGGNLSFSTSTGKSDLFKQHNTSIWVSPSLITIYKNNRGLGFNLNYAHLKTDPTGTSNSYGAGVFLRQYKPLGKDFYIFAQEAFAFNYTKATVDSTTYSSFVNNKGYQINFTANPGIAYDLSKKFQLEILFFNNLLSSSYSHSRLIINSNGTIQKYNSFSVGADLDASQLTALNIGAKIFFGR